MTNIDITTKAKVLLEALPYIQRFRGATFVIKYGGSFMDDPNPETRLSVATDIVFLASVGINVVVVHGGGKAISRAMEKAGKAPLFKNGLRVTDEETVQIVKQTLNGPVNLDICELTQAKGGSPLGMPGNTLFVCEKLEAKDENDDPVDLGYVGKIKYVKSKLIKKAISDNYIPVISPIAADENDRPFNTNADVAASAVASALRARRLVYMSDVPGLLSNPKDPSTLISTLKADEVDTLKKRGVISSGMVPKVDSAVNALENGVHRVHFIDGRQPHSILLEMFTDKGIGTEIVNR